jgi:hypothetical protein
MNLILFILLQLAGSPHPNEINEQSVSTGEFSIHVTAGAFDRSGTIVSFQAPHDMKQGVYTLTSGDGDNIHVQIDAANRGWFQLDYLPSDSSVTYSFLDDSDDDHTNEGVKSSMEKDVITFTAGTRKVLSYYHSENDPPAELDERYKRGGYIHPVYSPSGRVLTNHLNADLHPHHSGIWSAWTNTEFEGRTPDFWNVHQNTGRVDIDTLLNHWEGPVHGGFTSRLRFIDLSADHPVVALNEHWEVRVYSSVIGDSMNIFDLEITQTVNTDKPLLLPEYRYGGIGFRGHKDWDDPEQVFFLTPDGLGREGHGTRARWVHIGGYTDGELAGLAILGHPSNFRAPQTMRIHPDEPFFNFAPTQLGDMSIQPGVPFVARYRYVTHDGRPDPELIERLWRDYAYPPGVTVNYRSE